MLKIYPLFSGSSGNAILISGSGTNILIDCGVSGRRLEAALKFIGADPCALNAIFVTHEHSDHISGIGVLSRRFRIPIYTNEPTWEFIDTGRLFYDNIKTIGAGESAIVGDLCISSFQTPHDAACPVGYKISDGKESVAVATDIGVITEEVRSAVCGCGSVLLESNHDIKMLEGGKYPYFLKRRVRGNKGHLSNDEAGEFAAYLVKTGTQNLILGHLSRENNTPVIAYNAVAAALYKQHMKIGSDVTLKVAKPCIV